MTAAQFKQEFLTAYNAISSFGAPGYKDWEISTFLTKAQERIVLKRLNPKGNKYGEGVEQTEKRRVDLSRLITSALLTPAVNQTGTIENGTLFELPSNFLYTLNERAITNVVDCNHLGQYTILFANNTNPAANTVLRPGDTLYLGSASIATIVTGTNNFITVTLTSATVPVAGNVLTTSTATVTVLDAFPTTYVANIKPVTHDEYNANRNNPFKSPYEQLLWRMDYGGDQSNHEVVTNGIIYPTYYILRYYRKPLPIIVGAIAPRSIDGYSVVTDSELDSIVHREIIDEAVMIADADAEAKKVQVNAIETQKSE